VTLLEHFHNRLRCGAVVAEKQQHLTIKVAAATQPVAAMQVSSSVATGGKASEATASNNAKEHAHQQLKRN
jgi:hypothetical protein